MEAAGGDAASESRLAAWMRGRNLLQLAGLLLLCVAYRDLPGPGTHYRFTTGVEYWLFRPSDNAPMVIVALALWLLFRRRARIASLTSQPAPWYLVAPALALGASIYLWATYTGATDLKVISLAANALGLVLLYWGAAGIRVFWLPIAFLFFAIPIPAPLLLSITWNLQIWTAEYAGWLLYVLGEPALVAGDQILRATQTFQVIEGCSGLRTIETLAMLTVLLIDLFGRRGPHAVLLLLLTPAIAFVLNGLRVLTLILNPLSGVIAIHNLQGVVILMGGLLTVYAIDGLLERLGQFRERQRYPLEDEEASAQDEVPLGQPSVTGEIASKVAGEVKAETEGLDPRISSSHAVLFATALLTALASFTAPVWEEPETRLAAINGAVEEALSDWPSTKLEPDFVFRGSARFGWVMIRQYELEEGPVSLFFALSDLTQRGGSPLSPITKLPGTGWTVRDSKLRATADGDRTIEVRVVEKGKQRLLVHHWYDNAGSLGSEIVRSLLALDRSPLRRTRPIVVTRLSTELTGRAPDDIAAAEARLTAIYRRLDGALKQRIGN